MSIPDPIVLLDARARYVHPAFQMSRASTKTVFDSAGRLVTVPANALGWDHDPATGQARGYLAEPSATNLLLHSNDLTQGVWSKFQASVTGDAITGPDGNGMAKLVEDSASSTHSVYQVCTINDGATTVFQLIAKAGERQSVRVQIRNQDSPQWNRAEIDVSLTDGTISNANEAGTCELIDYGAAHISSGFYFIWIAATIGEGATSARAQAQLIDGNGDNVYQGDGTSGLYVGYCQAEEGSYPTSYIPTAGSVATRTMDSLVLSNLGDSPWWRSDRGALLVETSIRHMRPGGFLFQLGSLILRIWPTGSNNIVIYGMVPSTAVVVPGAAVAGRHLIAVSWGDGEVVTAAGGAIVDTQAIATPLGSNPALCLGVNEAATQPLGGYEPRAIYYPARLSNADLQSLTAIQE